jgi:phage terminase small subunit
MDKPSKTKVLGSKQEQFIHAYCVDQNATQAAKRAGYSHKCAGSVGARMLKNVNIKNKICTILRSISRNKNYLIAVYSIQIMLKADEGFAYSWHSV